MLPPETPAVLSVESETELAEAVVELPWVVLTEPSVELAVTFNEAAGAGKTNIL